MIEEQIGVRPNGLFDFGGKRTPCNRIPGHADGIEFIVLQKPDAGVSRYAKPARNTESAR